MNMTFENHESIKRIKELRLKNKEKQIKCYCVKKYVNAIKMYEIVKISHKKVYYILKSNLVTINDFLVALDSNSIDFVTEDKNEALKYINKFKEIK